MYNFISQRINGKSDTITHLWNFRKRPALTVCLRRYTKNHLVSGNVELLNYHLNRHYCESSNETMLVVVELYINYNIIDTF